jgi:hypothetical protein
MNLDNLKPAWSRHKHFAETSDITTDDILAAIGNDINRDLQTRRLIHNSLLFSLLVIFCQTC